MTPEKIADVIHTFAIRLKLNVKHPEPNIFDLDGFELYLPGYNSILDETLTDFQVYRGVTIPGRSYMPNGDPGYPDDYDLIEVGTFSTLLNALQKIGECIVSDWIDETGLFIAHAPEYED